MSAEKTVLTHIEAGLDFLGCSLRKFRGKLLIQPAKRSVQAFKDKLKAKIRANAQTQAGELIVQLNQQIRGWTNYYKPFVSKAAFGQIDWVLHRRMWLWLRRRHPTRKGAWLRRTYFPKGDWVMTGQVANRSGKLHPVRLVQAGSVPIVRHVKIRAEANPYDPAWEHYFEARVDARMKGTLTDRIAD